MVRKEAYVDEETCYNCGSEDVRLDELYSEGKGKKGDRHIEIHICSTCNTEGVVEYTPPASQYELKGVLFGEKEDISEIRSEAEDLS